MLSSQFAIGDQVIVSSIGGIKEDLVFVTSQGATPLDGLAVQRIYLFATVAERDAAFPAPTQAIFAWVDATETFYTWSAQGTPGWRAYLTNVAITSPATGHVLRYNGTSWVNVAVLDLERTGGTSNVLSGKVTGDTQVRIQVRADGTVEWGSGAATPDTNLYRSAVNTLATDDSFVVGGALTVATNATLTAGTLTLTDGTKQVNIGGSADTGAVVAKLAATGTVLLSGRVTTDTVNRIQVAANGDIAWGAGGSSATDTTLGRAGAGQLDTNAFIRSLRTGAVAAFVAAQSGDAVNRWAAFTDGKQEWGSGALTRDTNLYRSAADTLKTDDSLIVSLNFTVGTVQIDPTGAATGHILRHNGTKYVSVAEETVAQYPNATGIAVAPNATTTSTTFVNVGTNTSFSFTKNKASTKLRIQLNTSWYASATTLDATFGVLVNAVDYTIAKMVNSNSTARNVASGVIYITGLAAGSYTIQGRWKTSSSTINCDVNDLYMLDCMEVK